MAGEANDARFLWIKRIVSRSAERKRIGARNGHGGKEASDQHERQGKVNLPTAPVPKRHKRSVPRRDDQPGQNAQRQEGVGSTKPGRAEFLHEVRPDRGTNRYGVRHEERNERDDKTGPIHCQFPFLVRRMRGP